MNDELVQISRFLPEVKDRYFINKKGELFTDFGQRRMKDSLKGGYVKNDLVNKDGSNRFYFRHRLVMIVFNYREDYKDFQVNHIDGNKVNNCVENLEWCTNQENQIHAIKLGLKVSLKGQDNPAAKLTEEQVLDLIHDLLDHVPYSQICKKYNCSKSTVAAIKAKRNWRYLTENIDFD